MEGIHRRTDDGRGHREMVLHAQADQDGVQEPEVKPAAAVHVPEPSGPQDAQHHELAGRIVFPPEGKGRRASRQKVREALCDNMRNTKRAILPILSLSRFRRFRPPLSSPRRIVGCTNAVHTRTFHSLHVQAVALPFSE